MQIRYAVSYDWLINNDFVAAYEDPVGDDGEQHPGDAANMKVPLLSLVEKKYVLLVFYLIYTKETITHTILYTQQ